MFMFPLTTVAEKEQTIGALPQGGQGWAHSVQTLVLYFHDRLIG